ncbi:unnamed protein product, partial [Mesorhabditis belari]|uniref:Ensconsin n=1 Tax=Mesorhabditis belari TaxID=2138241 RepID=A0AAF3EG82_9BILA
MSTFPPGATSSNSTIGSARSGMQNGRSAGQNTEKKNHIDEVLRRKAEAEKIVAARKAALIAEQNEKLRKIQADRDRERKDRFRQQHEKELRRQKEALDRRQVYLDAMNNKKEAILAKAHAASSRTAQNKKQTFAFGSSTPRDISYLQSVPKEQRQYDKKLVPTLGPAPPSPKASPPPVAKPAKRPSPSPMTASMYVPSGTPTRTPRTSNARTSPPKVIKQNLMTQSMYSPASIKSTPKPVMTSTPKPKNTPVPSQRKNLPPAPTPRQQTKKSAETPVTQKAPDEPLIITKRWEEPPKIEEKKEILDVEEKNQSVEVEAAEVEAVEAKPVIEHPEEPIELQNKDLQEQDLKNELHQDLEKLEDVPDVQMVHDVPDEPIAQSPSKERSLNDELSELLLSDVNTADEPVHHHEIHPPFDVQEEPEHQQVSHHEPEMLLNLGDEPVKEVEHKEEPLLISEMSQTIEASKESPMEVEIHQKENGNSEHTDTSTSGDEEVAEVSLNPSIPPSTSSTSSPPPQSALRPPTPEERKAELLAKLEQEEKEREARKARLAAIMSRTRGGQGGESGGGDSPVQTVNNTQTGGMSALEKVAAMSGSSRINQILRREGSGSNLGATGVVQSQSDLPTSISDSALPGQVHDHIIA